MAYVCIRHIKILLMEVFNYGIRTKTHVFCRYICYFQLMAVIWTLIVKEGTTVVEQEGHM